MTTGITDPTREAEQDEVAAYLAHRKALPLSPLWQPIPKMNGWWRHRANGLAVIESVKRERDGRLWHHVSYSRRNRVPSWEDTSLIRSEFIGDDRECYSVLPPASRYVNTHQYTLHLWHCLDVPEGAVLPDFRHMGQI